MTGNVEGEDGTVLDKLIMTEAQQAAIDKVLAEPTQAALIASEMGTGKTSVAVEVIRRITPNKPVLIVAPLSTFIGWEKTIARQGIDIPVRRIATGKEHAGSFDDIVAGIPGIYLIGHAMFRRKEWRKVRLSVLIYDEVHDVSNRKSLGHRKLMNTKSEWRIAMSGTPAGNKFPGMWAVTRWLWPLDIDRSFWRWAAEFSHVEFDPYSGKKAEGEREPGKFVSTLPCYVRDRTSLEAQYLEEIRYVELTPRQRQVYSEMEQMMLMMVKGTGEENDLHVASLPIVQRARLRQITLGVPHINGQKWVTRKDKDGEKYKALVDDIDFELDTKSSKIDALKEITAAHEDENFLILMDSARFAKVTQHRMGDSARLWSGDTPQEEREHLLETFGKDFQYLVATIPSIGTGTDGLQHVCNHMVWLSRSEHRLLNEQSVARLLRTGQKKDVRSWDIQAHETYDSGIFQNLELQALMMQRSLG